MREIFKLLPVLIFLLVWTISVQHDPFFWDTVQLGSKHAHFFFQNGLNWLPLPEGIDSGHPPLFGYALAVLWFLFGKTLAVGHWAMLPFLCGIAVLLLRLGGRLGSPGMAAPWLIPLVFLDPVVAGQSTLVSPDIVLVFCFLLTTEGLLSRRQPWVLAGVAGLCAISTRGMMTAGALFVWQLLAHWRPRLVFFPHRFSWFMFLPGFAFALWFLTWHYRASGWIGYHPRSPWAASFQMVDVTGFLRNLLVVGWRWVDLGRIFEWGILLFFLFSGGINNLIQLFTGNRNQPGYPADKRFLRLGAIVWSPDFVLLFICLLIFLTPSALLYRNLSAHRYFLPVFLAFHFLVFQALALSNLAAVRKQITVGILIAGLALGNLWIYPRGISMDWDSTLAYLPYHRLRADMLEYLDQKKIRFETVGTTFPNRNTGEDLLLNGDWRCFAEKDFSHNSYMLTSNVLNDFSNRDYDILERQWLLMKRVEHAGVWMELYQRKN